jgi:hypothetical protein
MGKFETAFGIKCHRQDWILHLNAHWHKGLIEELEAADIDISELGEFTDQALHAKRPANGVYMILTFAEHHFVVAYLSGYVWLFPPWLFLAQPG